MLWQPLILLAWHDREGAACPRLHPLCRGSTAGVVLQSVPTDWESEAS